MSSNPGQGAEPIQPASQGEITDSPLWHFHDYDLGHGTFTLMRIEEQLYREASFLDSRIQEYECPSVRYELKHLAGMFPRLEPSRSALGFIFHIGHCGSTLLSRALAVSARTLPLREPLTLRNLSADERELDSPMAFMSRPDWEWLLATVLDSFSRRFRPAQLNIVKATSTGNNLIRPILDANPGHRALLLHVSLESYLATMLGKDKQGGDLWGQARTRMRDLQGISADPGFSLHQLSAAQLAVLSWLTSMNFLLAARDRFGERVLMLDFEQLLAEPESHLRSAAAFFGLTEDSDAIAAGFAEVASGYSKRPSRRYTPALREELLRRTRTECGQEISEGMAWGESLMARIPGLAALGEFSD